MGEVFRNKPRKIKLRIHKENKETNAKYQVTITGDLFYNISENS